MPNRSHNSSSALARSGQDEYKSDIQHEEIAESTKLNERTDAAGEAKPKRQASLTAGKRKKQRDEQLAQWLGDKVRRPCLLQHKRSIDLRLQTVADVVEALIGAAFLTKQYDLAFRVTKVLNVPFPAVRVWEDFTTLSKQHEGSKLKLAPSIVKDVQKITGYKFTRTSLLAEALVC